MRCDWKLQTSSKQKVLRMWFALTSTWAVTLPKKGTRWCSHSENISISFTITTSSWFSSKMASFKISVGLKWTLVSFVCDPSRFQRCEIIFADALAHLWRIGCSLLWGTAWLWRRAAACAGVPPGWRLPRAQSECPYKTSPFETTCLRLQIHCRLVLLCTDCCADHRCRCLCICRGLRSSFQLCVSAGGKTLRDAQHQWTALVSGLPFYKPDHGIPRLLCHSILQRAGANRMWIIILPHWLNYQLNQFKATLQLEPQNSIGWSCDLNLKK